MLGQEWRGPRGLRRFLPRRDKVLICRGPRFNVALWPFVPSDRVGMYRALHGRADNLSVTGFLYEHDKSGVIRGQFALQRHPTRLIEILTGLKVSQS